MVTTEDTMECAGKWEAIRMEYRVIGILPTDRREVDRIFEYMCSGIPMHQTHAYGVRS